MVKSQLGQNSSRDPILKNPSQKKAGRVAHGISPEFQTPVLQKKKKKKRKKKSKLFSKDHQALQ
jgi:hypothetical protein